VRTTRQVTLTSDGELLLPYARRVLEAQDALLTAFARGNPQRPLLVDVNSRASSPAASSTAPADSPGQRADGPLRERAHRRSAGDPRRSP